MTRAECARKFQGPRTEAKTFADLESWLNRILEDYYKLRPSLQHDAQMAAWLLEQIEKTAASPHR